MKKHAIFALLFLGFGFSSHAQNSEGTPQKTIELFFKAFHEQDTTVMRSLTYGEISLRSIGKDKTGTAQISSESFAGFLKSIASVPNTMIFQEKIHSYEIKTDGEMAHVWTPYTFFVNGKLSHCGVNSFQLFKENGEWKIISIVDTRRKNNCKE